MRGGGGAEFGVMEAGLAIGVGGGGGGGEGREHGAGFALGLEEAEKGNGLLLLWSAKGGGEMVGPIGHDKCSLTLVGPDKG